MGCVEMIVMDTHVLVWLDQEERKLGKKSRALIERKWASGVVAVSAITFWEVGTLVNAERLRLPGALAEWRSDLLNAGLVELPVDGSIAMRAAELAGLHGDPADRLISATALVHGASLMTADEKLLAWRHPLERHDARL
jgi:PIN domain nuclease of toxin-antitoxin system